MRCVQPPISEILSTSPAEATPLAAAALGATACAEIPADGPAAPRDAGADGAGGRTALPAWDPAFEKRVYSTKLPVVWVDVQGSHFDIPRDTKVPGRVRIIEDHDGTHKNLKNLPATLDTPIGISVRGRSSASFPQKSYTFEVQKADGSAGKARVLDMPSGEDWSLVTCWGDKTCMRNALALWMARQFGYWAARTRYVELYLNGRYNGIYALTEPIRQERSRIDIAKPAPAAEEGDISGGYIFRREAGGRGTPTTNPPRDWLSPYKPVGISPATDKVPNPLVYSYHHGYRVDAQDPHI